MTRLQRPQSLQNRQGGHTYPNLSGARKWEENGEVERGKRIWKRQERKRVERKKKKGRIDRV